VCAVQQSAQAHWPVLHHQPPLHIVDHLRYGDRLLVHVQHGPLAQPVQHLLGAGSGWLLVIPGIMVVLVAPVFEELYFRGVVLRYAPDGCPGDRDSLYRSILAHRPEAAPPNWPGAAGKRQA